MLVVVVVWTEMQVIGWGEPKLHCKSLHLLFIMFVLQVRIIVEGCAGEEHCSCDDHALGNA